MLHAIFVNNKVIFREIVFKMKREYMLKEALAIFGKFKKLFFYFLLNLIIQLIIFIMS